MIAELIMHCFHARTVAHILHFKARSYAQHIALNEFYDGIVPLVDSLTEAYQGDYGIIDDYPTTFRMFPDGAALLEDLADWIVENRADIADEGDTHLQNIIDEMMALIRSTQYKLKFLK